MGPMNPATLVLSSCLLMAVAPAQRALTTVFGPVVNGRTGERVAGAADMDGDMVPDLLVSSPLAGNGRIHLVSGATFASRDLISPVPGAIGDSILFSAGDMNGDGTPDVVVNRTGDLVAISGATATILWQTSGLDLRGAAPIGDVDADNRADLAVVTYNNGNYTQWRMSGANGALLPGALSLGFGPSAFLTLGDIDGDGVVEVAIANGNSVQIVRSSPPQVLRNIVTLNTTCLGAGNFAGDARNELLIGDPGTVRVYSTTTGGLIRTVVGGNGQFAVVGDLDADGWDDFSLRNNNNPGSGHAVDFVSGGSGRMLARWLGTSRLHCQVVAGAGDIDQDGYGDLLLGDPAASTSGIGPTTGGWQLISGKLLASVSQIPVQCGQGPWLPQLGMTRPLLGQTVTIEGRDCPAGANGILALSRQPALPYNFGVVGCDAWWDLSNWAMLNTTTTTSWQLLVPLPNVPQLAGLDVALQAFYLPTASPVGFDLSNALWARFGF